MITSEYLELFMKSKKGTIANSSNEESVYEVAQLTSGSFVFSLHDCLSHADMEMDMIAEHLENLYDTANHYGLVYFIIMLAEATGFELPKTFIQMTLNYELVPILSAAIIEDWLDI